MLEAAEKLFDQLSSLRIAKQINGARATEAHRFSQHPALDLIVATE